MKDISQFKIALDENEVETKLKNYFRKLTTLVGEEYTYLTLTTDYSIKDSISRFSYDFESYSDIDITLALLKGAILSNVSDSFSINLVKQLVSEKKIDDLIFLSDNNLAFRRDLTANYIFQHECSNEKLYNRSNKKQSVRSNLLNLKRYQDELKEKRNSILKRGNN